MTVHGHKRIPSREGGIEIVVEELYTRMAALGKHDVVHFHAEGPCAMIWLPNLFGKRCVATIHGLGWQREKWVRLQVYLSG